MNRSREEMLPPVRHERDCAYVVSDGPAPCTCDFYEREREEALAIAQKRVNEMEAALKPFADFADPQERVPAEMHITQGSYLVKRQLLMGDCYKARAALRQAQSTDVSPTPEVPGESEEEMK